MSKPYFDIAFIVPLREEYEVLTEIFPVISDRVDGTQFHARLDTGTSNVTAVAYLQDDMGKAAASRSAGALLQAYDVGITVVIGIAGGLSSDVGIGHICLSGSVVDVLENSRLVSNTLGYPVQEFAPKFFSTNSLLTFAFKYVSLGVELKSTYEAWQSASLTQARVLNPEQFYWSQGTF